MTAQEYLEQKIHELSKPIVMEDIGNTPVEDAIYAKVMSKKFRKLKPGNECVKLTKEAIKLLVKDNQPITFLEMFGGNKLWRFSEAPEIDWAEVFSLIYFMEWMRLIASVYKPGVRFVYFSQDISVESLNNVPRSETDQYSKTFKELLNWIKPHLPPNITISYQRHYDLFKNPDDYLTEIEECKKVILAKNNGELPKLDEKMKAATELNVKLKPGQDKDPLWREKVELQHQAIFEMKTLQPVMNNPAKIWTCPTYYPDSVVTGSTKKSLAKFWAGVGALKKNSDSYSMLVLTPSQLEKVSFKWEPIEIEGLENIGKNLKKVRILDV